MNRPTVLAATFALLAASCDPMCPVEILNKTGSGIVVQQYHGLSVTATNGGLAVVPPSLDPSLKIGGRTIHYDEIGFVDENVCIKYGRPPLSHPTPMIGYKFDKTVFLTLSSSGEIVIDNAAHIALSPQPAGFPKDPR